MTSILSTTWFALIFCHNSTSKSNKCHQEMDFMSVRFFSLSWWSTARSKIIEASRLICHTFPFEPQLFIPLSCLLPHDSVVLVLFIHSCLSLFHSVLESLLLNSSLVWSRTFSPAFNMTWFFMEASLLKCKLAEHVTIKTLFLPCHLLLGHLFQTEFCV